MTEMSCATATITNSAVATDEVLVTMPDADDMMYHLSHVKLGLTKVTNVARVSVGVLHLVFCYVVQTCITDTTM